MSDLQYAALDLRMAMEAIVYDRALSFKDEFPEREYDTWQPKRIMTILIEIEPTAYLTRQACLCPIFIGSYREVFSYFYNIFFDSWLLINN